MFCFSVHTHFTHSETLRGLQISFGKERAASSGFHFNTKSANDNAKVSITLYVAELNEHRQNRWKEQNNSKRQTVTTNQHQEFQDMT